MTRSEIDRAKRLGPKKSYRGINKSTVTNRTLTDKKRWFLEELPLEFIRIPERLVTLFLLQAPREPFEHVLRNRQPVD